VYARICYVYKYKFRSFTEIPEPDYDDDSDDDVTEPASGFYDNERDDQDETTAADERPENGKQRRVEDADDARQVSTSDDDHLDDNNVGVDNSLDFDGARAKLEAFSLEQRRLRGSVRAADPGCGRAYEGFCWALTVAVWC